MRTFKIIIGTWKINRVKRNKMKKEVGFTTREISVNINSDNIDDFGYNPENHINGFDIDNDFVKSIFENGIEIF